MPLYYYGSFLPPMTRNKGDKDDQSHKDPGKKEKAYLTLGL